MPQEVEHRLTRLETRLDYTEAMIGERKLILASHTRRLADIENRVHDLTAIQARNVERIAKVEVKAEATSEEVRDARKRRQAQMALVQWTLTFAMGFGVVVGVMGDGTADVWQGILGGLSPRP